MISSGLLLVIFGTVAEFAWQTSASRVFQVQLSSFQNDRGLDVRGECCRGSKTTGVCSDMCRTFFRVCLSHYQSHNPDEPMCTYGQITTPVIGSNTFSIPKKTDNFTNPVQFAFSFRWPGSFSLVIDAWHSNNDGDNKYVPSGVDLGQAGTVKQWALIYRTSTQQVNYTGHDWTRGLDATGRLQYEYRLLCGQNYYGPRCTDVCRPRDDKFGHYSCNTEGILVCHDGWSGEYCDKPICLPGCHELHGSCEVPNECKCRLGWHGQLCNQCIRYPGCQHGTCQQPWQCNCDVGWGGIFCTNQLLY